MADDLSRDVALLDRDLVAVRRDLHRHPELGYAEVRTAQLVAERLRALGLSVRTGIGGTGIIADLEGERPGRTVLLRADMDALPVEEQSGHDFPSETRGVMHACGHDAHVSALLGAARLLAERRDRIAGKVRFVFQPAEELSDGALHMIRAGALDGVDKAFGAHVISPLPFGVVATRTGPFFAGYDAFEIAVVGKAGHGGLPHMSVDPIYAAAQVVTALQSIVAREVKPGEPLVVSISAISGGNAANVVVERVTLQGTVRWFSRESREHALERVQAIASGVCSALRATCEFKVVSTAPVTANAAAPVELIAAAARATGRADVIDPGPLTVSEDFSEFTDRVPGCLFTVGAGGPTAAPHHHHAFDLDERAIGLIAEIFTRATLSALRPE
ncbi:M20 metallopeptidase family protein [Sorangium sp. So ce1024]|uniref:M20 metallopeptidase family protein n=1 Tax=Sorangium sp. So ce1024 TaxID=3133327 RepID=UPI003F08440A